jgi:hypothetical protein
MAQVLQCLPSKHKALSLNSSTEERKGESKGGDGTGKERRGEGERGGKTFP